MVGKCSNIYKHITFATELLYTLSNVGIKVIPPFYHVVYNNFTAIGPASWVPNSVTQAVDFSNDQQKCG